MTVLCTAALAIGQTAVSSLGERPAAATTQPAPQAAADKDAPAKPVRIYLPRETQVSGSAMKLCDVALVRCGDQQLRAKVASVELGRAPFAKEKMTLDRRTILSRLAACGVKAEDVEITGAPAATLLQKDQTAACEKLLAAAQNFLNKDRPGPAGCMWRLVGKPPQIGLPQRADAQLQVKPAPGSNDARVLLVVSAVAGKEELASVTLAYDVVYPAQQAVAARDIPAGTKLASEHFKIETVTVPRKPAEEFTPPLGMVCTQAVAAGAAIRPGILKAPKAEVVVRRNQNVVMRINGPGFSLSAVGAALADGRTGEFIKVKNVDTGGIVNCRVAADGSVSPVYEEVKK